MKNKYYWEAVNNNVIKIENDRAIRIFSPDRGIEPMDITNIFDPQFWADRASAHDGHVVHISEAKALVWETWGIKPV